MAFDQSGEPKIREARDSDAAQISGLYRQAYTPAHSGDARKSYPFPQFLVAEEVAEIIRKEEILWIVADLRGRVVGTVGAVHNIAGEKDCVAEAFGLVVDKEFRVRRVATNMVKALWELLNQDTCFILVEARTAHQGGWRILRGCGFAPIGLEPFAHSTPAGSEAMLLTARIAKTALKKRIMDFKPLRQSSLCQIWCFHLSDLSLLWLNGKVKPVATHFPGVMSKAGFPLFPRSLPGDSLTNSVMKRPLE